MSLLAIWAVLATVLCIFGFGALTLLGICEDCHSEAPKE